MEHQTFGRPQRPRGANIKQALKLMLILAVCAWLIYQIKHSRNKTDNYGGQTKLAVGYGALPLGRKGTPLQLDERALPDSGNVDSAGETRESSNGSDDVFDGAKEDKAEEEFGHINEKFSTNEGKEVEVEPQGQPKVSSKNKYKHSSKEKSGKVNIESMRSESHKEHGNKKYPKRPVINDSQSNVKETGVRLRQQPNDVQVRKNAKSYFSNNENDENEDPRIREKETRTQESVVENATNGGVTEGIVEVRSFHDENGVPPDGNETEVFVGQAQILHEENISSVSKGSRLNIDLTADEEINTGTITHADTSGINRNSVIGEGDSLVL